MPSQNVIKKYEENGLYHVYNRGLNKQIVFFDSQDYYRFRYFARETMEEMLKVDTAVEIYSYSLLPNHFHFILWQQNRMDMARFMKNFSLKYVMYFNRKYKRSGNVFSRPYRARKLRGAKDVAVKTKYVLDNPREAGLPDDWEHVGVKL